VCGAGRYLNRGCQDPYGAIHAVLKATRASTPQFSYLLSMSRPKSHQLYEALEHQDVEGQTVESLLRLSGGFNRYHIDNGCYLALSFCEGRRWHARLCEGRVICSRLGYKLSLNATCAGFAVFSAGRTCVQRSWHVDCANLCHLLSRNALVKPRHTRISGWSTRLRSVLQACDIARRIMSPPRCGHPEHEAFYHEPSRGRLCKGGC
jgi:hypothetical protein